MDACVKHLGVLPSQANLTNDQVTELLTYHRIQAKAQRVCRECAEKDRDARKTCFVCGREYTDQGGPIAKAGEKDEVLLDMMQQMARVGQKGVTDKSSEEEKAALRKAHAEAAKKRGVMAVPEGLTVAEMQKMLAKRK